MYRRRTHLNGHLRAALIETAVALIAEKGFEALSVAEITRRLAISGSAPYRHFATRDLLLAATAAEMGRQLAEDMQVAAADANGRIGTRGGVDALAAAMAAYAKFVAQRRAGFDFIFSKELAEQQCENLIHASRSVMDMLVPLALEVAGDAAAALRLLDRQISAAHGLGILCRTGLVSNRSPEIDAVGADADGMARVLSAAASRDVARARSRCATAVED